MGRLCEVFLRSRRWRLLLILAFFYVWGTSHAVYAQATPPQAQTSDYQIKLNQAYELISSSPFVYSEDEVDKYAEASISLSSSARIYALWRVLYAYKDSQNDTKFRYWQKRIMQQAQKENDSDLDLLARFMLQAHENERSGFVQLTEREWDVYLNAPNRAISNIASLERQRLAQFGRQWAEAIDLGEALAIRLEADGKDAQALLSVAQQTLAYNMLMVGDHQSYADHMLAVAKLAQENAFFFLKK